MMEILVFIPVQPVTTPKMQSDLFPVQDIDYLRHGYLHKKGPLKVQQSE